MVAHRLLRNLAWTGVVLGVLLFVAFGLPALDRVIPADRALNSGRPYVVGAEVTVQPPPGAQLDASKTRPGQDRGTALFLLGAIRYVIVVAPFDGTMDDAAAKLRAKIQANRGYQVTGAEEDIVTAGRLSGVAGGYSAPGRTGKYAVLLANGLAIEVTVSGAGPELADRHRAINDSINSISLSGAR